MSIRILALADSRFCQSIARHLIQSFLLGEATPEIAHKIGLKLCNKILKDEYEFILSTHIDKGQIHNHIIFNNVNMVTGKCYQSNERNYHQIRYQSDKLYKENSLSVIDEYYERFMQEYSSSKSEMTKLCQIMKNYEKYMEKEMEK